VHGDTAPFVECRTMTELIHDMRRLSGFEDAMADEPAAGTES
jgi:hypothetical protein